MPVPKFARNYVAAQQPKAPAITPQSAAMAQKFGPSMSAAGAPPVGTPMGKAPAPSAGMMQKFGPPSVAAGAPRMMGGMKKGGKVSSASKRADGIAQRGKTKGKIV